MSDSVKLEIVVDDQGSLVIKNFKETVGKAFGDLPKETGKADAAMAASWKQMAKGTAAALGLGFGISEATGFVKDSVKAYIDEERQHARLISILNQHGENAQETANEIDAFAKKMEYLTGASGDQIKSLEILARQYEIQGNKVDDAIRGSIGLTQIGGSLESNLLALANAYTGNWRQLGQLIPEIRSASSESERLDILQRKIAEGLNIASAAMKTNAGALAELSNWWGDLKKKVGEFTVTAAHGLDAMHGNRRMAAEITRALVEQQERLNNRLRANNTVLQESTSLAAAARDPIRVLVDVESDLATAYLADVKANAAFVKQLEAQEKASQRMQAAERKAAEFREQYGSVTEGLTRAGWELLFQTMQLTGFLPEFNAETQRAAEEQEALATRMRDLIDAEGQMTAAGEGVLIGLYQWAGLLPTVTTGTDQSSEATKKWTINWKDANEVMQFAQSMVAGITDLLGAMGIELGASGEAALQAASGIGQLWAGISSGNPMQIISGVTQALTGLVKLFSGDGVGEAIARENEWMDLTKQQTEQIRELERQYGSTHAATSELLDQFIGSADITAASFDQWTERMRGILSDLDQGKMSLAQTQAEIGDAFTALISKAQELGTEGSASLISFYEDLANRGIQVAEVQEYINSKLEAGADFYADLKDMIDSSSVAQQVFGNISVPIFDEILAYRQKLAENDDLVKSIGAATNMMVSLTDATRIEQAQFDQFALSGIRSFDALIAGGMNSSQALQAMAPYLQRLQFLHEQYGFTIDENTQRILDQAKQEGVVFENKKTEQQQVIDLLSIIARQLGADIPGALDTTAQAASEAFKTATREAGKFDEALDEIGKTRTITIGTKKGKGNAIEAATGFHGWVAPRSYTEFVTGEDEAEYVSITPQSELNRAAAAPAVWTPQAGGQTLIIEDHSVLNVHVDPKSGIDQNALADGIRLVIEDNRNLVTDKIAKAVQRRI